VLEELDPRGSEDLGRKYDVVPDLTAGSLPPRVDLRDVVIAPAEMMRQFVDQHMHHQLPRLTFPRSAHSSSIGRRNSQIVSGCSG
jgi:hypothetical protein